MDAPDTQTDALHPADAGYDAGYDAGRWDALQARPFGAGQSPQAWGPDVKQFAAHYDKGYADGYQSVPRPKGEAVTRA